MWTCLSSISSPDRTSFSLAIKSVGISCRLCSFRTSVLLAGHEECEHVRLRNHFKLPAACSPGRAWTCLSSDCPETTRSSSWSKREEGGCACPLLQHPMTSRPLFPMLELPRWLSGKLLALSRRWRFDPHCPWWSHTSGGEICTP